MKQMEIKKVMVEIPSAIICDVCGEKYDLTNYIEEAKAKEFLSLDFQAGYFSPFEDGSIVKCDICPKCVLDLLGKYCRVKNIYDEE